MDGQMLRRIGVAAAGASTGGSIRSPSAPMSSMGTTTSTSSSLRAPASTTVTGRGATLPSEATVAPPRKRAISSSGRWVADSAIRCGGSSHSSSSRSSDNIRWAPRLVPARAWISSMMTCPTLASVSRARDVSIRNSDSGVVMRMSGGWRTSWRRSLAGVSPVRMPTVGVWTSVPDRSAAKPMPRRGARRFFSTSTARARNGER